MTSQSNKNLLSMQNLKTMSDIKRKYKAETGNSAWVYIETRHLTDSMDSVFFEGMSGSEIRSLMEYDTRHNAKYGVFIDELPKEYIEDDYVCLTTPEYVEWLEEQVTELIRFKNGHN